MTDQFSGKRYRPILRLNDLLHPIQQRERMQQFSTVDEPIGPYPNYSRLWAPTRIPALFLTKVPRSATRLSEDAYLTLMKQRMQWMMQTWMQSTNSSPAETQRMLESHLGQLTEPSAVSAPGLDEDIDGYANERGTVSSQWREDWAEVFVGSDRFSELLFLQGVKFPVQTYDHNHADFQDWLALLQDTDLETWLSLLCS
ncbi:MAG: hypothetical protein NW224_03420 [Leptolyngbyaceae cyanobacterium bins.302]|nr:hypothetical protein [Leptolyngbyaceae cyanobacterium bins.302]